MSGKLARDSRTRAMPAASLVEVPIRRRSPTPPVPPAAARTTASESVIRPEPAPVPVAAVVPSTQPVAASRPGVAHRTGDILAFWHDHRRGRAVPAWADFDPADLGQRWPNCLLLTCVAGPGGSATIARASRIGPASAGDDAPEYCPMTTEWMLSLGRQAVRTGRPIQDVDEFPLSTGFAKCRIVVLPLCDQAGRISHLLCHLSRA